MTRTQKIVWFILFAGQWFLAMQMLRYGTLTAWQWGAMLYCVIMATIISTVGAGTDEETDTENI